MITINLDKAKQVGHKHRRFARAGEFLPFDEIIAKQIPGADAQEAEVQRQLIREKYAIIQEDIDSATNIDDLTQVVKLIELPI